MGFAPLNPSYALRTVVGHFAQRKAIGRNEPVAGSLEML
jgi:hypothetical protein